MKLLHLGLCANDTSITKSFKKYFDEVVEVHTSDPNFNIAAVNEAEKMKPDIIFMQIQNPNTLQEATARLLKATGAWVVNWTGDVRAPLPQWYVNVGRDIDMTLFTNMNDVETMKAIGLEADYLDIGYDPEIFYPDWNTVKDVDISFLGNNYRNLFPLSELRIELAQKMKEVFKDKFKLYGNGWTNHDGNLNHSQIHEANFYRTNKIAINCSHFDYWRYSSDRMLRIMGCGVLCMTKWYPGIELDYAHGENVVIWHDIDDLVSKCQYYLENEEERQRIAVNGQKHIFETRTFDKMVEGLIEIYNGDQD